MVQGQRRLIIGGHDAPANQYPYFATFDHFGGGILIAPDIVLTAGHVNPPLEQPVRIRLNHSHFQSTYFGLDPPDDETFGIAAIAQHPEYYTISWDENVNDFNIVVLDGFSKVTPVRLNRNPNIPEPGQMVTVVGMGSMDRDPAKFFESSATTLQEVELEILSQEQCLKQSGHDPARPDLTYRGRLFGDQMMCTSGGPHNEKDACAFDSGSPLIVQQQYHHHHHHQLYPVVVGLVSWGEDCADPYFPAVNARISYAMEWIDATVCKLSKADPSLLSDFRCDRQGYSWKYAQMFSTTQRRDVNNTGGASGVHAILALVVAAGVGVVAIAWRSLRDQHHPRRHSMRMSTRSMMSTTEERLLSMHPSKAAKERNPVSPEESVKTYDTFAGQSV